MGLKTAFNEIVSRLNDDTSITTVFKGQRESISSEQMPVAFVFSISDRPEGTAEKASRKYQHSIREYEVVVFLGFKVTDADEVEEDALDWAKTIKDDLAASSYRLNDKCNAIGFGNVFYHPTQQMEHGGRNWYKSGVEVHVFLTIGEDYS